MNKGKKLYEGKAKIIYETKEKGLVIQHFKDDATAFNNLKKANVEGKGVLNNRISEHILQNLNQAGIKTQLIKRLNMREQLVKLVEIIPELPVGPEQNLMLDNSQHFHTEVISGEGKLPHQETSLINF